MNHVEPIPGELLRFFVRSRTDPATRYLCDLAANNLQGECGCPHFAHIPNKRKPGPKCWHLRQAREYLATIMIAKLSNYHGDEKLDRKRELTGP